MRKEGGGQWRGNMCSEDFKFYLFMSELKCDHDYFKPSSKIKIFKTMKNVDQFVQHSVNI